MTHAPTRRIAAVALACSCATPVGAQDWPQWRGPERDGTVAASQAPADWPASWQEAWRVEVGEGYASPVTSGGRVFVHSRRDPQEVVTALDEATGRIVWQQVYDAAFSKNQYAVRMAKGPNATPLVAGGRVFTFGVTAILTAWDAATGRHLWRKDFSKTVDTSKLFCGTAASPLLVDGLLIVQAGSDIHGGRIVGLDPADGTTKWEWRGPGPGYASPSALVIADTPQVVTLTNSSIVSLDGRTGRELWSTPLEDEFHENIVTPVWTGTHLVVSGTRLGTRAFAVTRNGGAWRVTEAWSNAEVAMYMSSPVAGDGLVYGHSTRRKGQFVALDGRTGAVKWASDPRQGDHASILLTPRHVVFLTNGADLIVARRTAASFEVEKSYDVARSETWAYPVMLGRDLLVREATALVRLAGR